MPRSSRTVLTPLLLLLMLPPLLVLEASVVPVGTNDSCSLESCAKLQFELFQEYATQTNLGAGEDFLPFGTLASDWPRLLLLLNHQPKSPALHDSILRLSRLILASYFESQEPHGWDDYALSTERTTSDEAMVTPLYTDIDEQQANNVTSNSVELEDVDSPTTNYEFLVNFNYSSVLKDYEEDNDTSESESSDSSTTAPDEEEDESFRTSPVTITDLINGFYLIQHRIRSNGFEEEGEANNTRSDGLASARPSEEDSKDESWENEAIHERSKENFVVSRLWIKDNKEEAGDGNFSVHLSDETMGDHLLESPGDISTRYKNATDSLLSLEKEPELLGGQDVEIDSTEAPNTVNNTDLDGNEVQPRPSESSGGESSEELLTKSIHDFLDSSYLPELVNGTDSVNGKILESTSPVMENDSWYMGEGDESTSESMDELLEAMEQTNDLYGSRLSKAESTLTENSIFTESIANDRPDPTGPADSHDFESRRGETETPVNNSFNTDKLIDASTEPNLTDRTENDTRRLLLKLDSKDRFSNLSQESAPARSYDITGSPDTRTTSTGNEREAHFVQYQSIPTVTLASNLGEGLDKDDAGGLGTDIPGTGIEGGSTRSTIDRANDDFWYFLKAGSTDEDGLHPSEAVISDRSDPQSILIIYNHNGSNSIPAITKSEIVEEALSGEDSDTLRSDVLADLSTEPSKNGASADTRLRDHYSSLPALDLPALIFPQKKLKEEGRPSKPSELDL